MGCCRMVRLGELVQLSDERNSEERYTIDDVVGISTAKTFISTKANLDGVSLSSYKIVSPSSFAYVADTSRRGDKIALAYNQTDKAFIISGIYTTFRVKDSSTLLPEFLFLLFNRPEFDRYARYNSWGSARETFDWDEMQRIVLPLPPISYQRQLVGIYKGLTSVIEENESLLDPLNAACQAYIVDCKEKYKAVRLGELVELSDERNSEERYTIDDVVGISTAKTFISTKAKLDGVSLSSYKIVSPSSFAYVADTSRRGDKIALAYNQTDKAFIISGIYTTFHVKATSSLLPEFLFLLFNRPEFDRYARYNSWGSARETFDWEEMQRVALPLPPIDVQRSIVSLYHCAEESRRLIADAREQLRQLCPALVQLAKHYNDESA